MTDLADRVWNALREMEADPQHRRTAGYAFAAFAAIESAALYALTKLLPAAEQFRRFEDEFKQTKEHPRASAASLQLEECERAIESLRQFVDDGFDAWREREKRMKCLREFLAARGWSDMLVENEMRPWKTRCNAAILRAMAKCPLRADAGRVWFDADEFLQIVLGEMEPQGRA